MCAIWSSFESVISPNLDRPTVQIAWEWPSTCSYWTWCAGGGGGRGSVGKDHQSPMVSMLARYLRHSAFVHRCERTLVAHCGPRKRSLLSKIYRVDTSYSDVSQKLTNGRVRVEWRSTICKHGPTRNHARVEGAITLATEGTPTRLQHWPM